MKEIKKKIKNFKTSSFGSEASSGGKLFDVAALGIMNGIKLINLYGFRRINHWGFAGLWIGLKILLWK